MKLSDKIQLLIDDPALNVHRGPYLICSIETRADLIRARRKALIMEGREEAGEKFRKDVC